MAMNGDKLGKLLMDADIITKRQLAKAVQKQANGDKRKIGEILVEMNFVTVEDLTEVMMEQANKAQSETEKGKRDRLLQKQIIKSKSKPKKPKPEPVVEKVVEKPTEISEEQVLGTKFTLSIQTMIAAGTGLASLIGMCLGVDEVWFMTDVDGLLTANPKIYPTAKTIPQLSYGEAVEMATMGAKGMHARALEPAKAANIPVRIKNTFRPDGNGTLINDNVIVKPEEITKAVASLNGLAMITIAGMNMVGNPGTAGEIFSMLGRNKINIIMISQSISEANITFLIKRENLRKAVSVLQVSLLGKSSVTDVTSDDEVCVVSIVGAGMKGTSGVAAKLFTAISGVNVNVKMIAQGSSEQNISFVVQESDLKQTIEAIHKEFRMD